MIRPFHVRRFPAPSGWGLLLAVGALMAGLTVLAAPPVRAGAFPAAAAGPDDLAAARFVVVDAEAGSATVPSAVPAAAPAYAVWVDGKRRVGALGNAVASPFLLLSPGDRALEIRTDTTVFFGATVTVTGGTSTTYLVESSADGVRLITVPDTGESITDRSVRIINVTPSAVEARVGQETFSILPHSVSPAYAATPGPEPTVLLGDRPVSVDEREKGAKLLLVTHAADGTDPVVATISANRYPSPLLRVGDVEPARSPAPEGHSAEFWLRRILAAFVIVLVVASTLATLKSFRTEALDSRVRARM